MKTLLGSIGANLSGMTNIGLPVPPALTITTEACMSYYEYGRQYPEEMWNQTQISLMEIENMTGKKFGDVVNPLLVSVRPSTAISLPGMMDTILNLGLNDETVEGLGRRTGDRRFALDAYRRFIALFGHIVMGIRAEKFDRVLGRYKSPSPHQTDTNLTVAQLQRIIQDYKHLISSDSFGDAFPQNVYDQLRMAITAVFDSWQSYRAIDYRRIHGIDDRLGTAVNIQAMVFGNMGWKSGIGVASTRNLATGEKEIYGEYLLNAPEEEIVAGLRKPNTIDTLAKDLPTVYAQLYKIASRLECHYGDTQDIEFAIEQGELWILQTRPSKRTDAAVFGIKGQMPMTH